MLASNIPKNSPLLEVCPLSPSLSRAQARTQACAYALESWLHLSRSNGHMQCS
jgi:hypothetical protein